MLNEPTLEDLKAGIDIVEYIGRHTVLKKSGKEYTGLCPIHGEKTPSFFVNESKQVFHCQGCHAGGSILDFIMGIYGIDEGGAAQQLKSELGVDRGAPILEKKRLITDDQARCESYVSSCNLSQPCGALMNYGLILPSAYENNNEDLAIPLRTKTAVEDVFLLGESRGKSLVNKPHDGWHVVGQHDEHSRNLYICDDYIDAIYLHKNTGSSKLIVFSPWILHAIERVKREYQSHEIRLALSNTTSSEMILDSWSGLYTMPEERGFWCEKSRKQQIKGCKRA